MKKIVRAVNLLRAAIEEETGVKDGLTRLCLSPRAFDEYMIKGAREFSYKPSDMNNSHICGIKLDSREGGLYE